MKKTFSLLISMTLYLGGVVMGQENSRTNAGATLPSTRRNGAAVRFAPRQIRAANRRLRYTVKAKYPQAIGAARDLRLAKLNRELKSLVTTEVNEFTSYFHQPALPPTEILGPTGSYYENEYWITLATNELVSLAFGVSVFGEGAAHPNHYTDVFNYDLKAGRALNLSDLFKPNSNYLSLISSYTIKELKVKLGPDPDTDWIERGAGASEDNYENWNLTLGGLQITFDPYQVASYAEGEHTVVIPYSVLKDLINPNGPLARMTGRN